MNMKSVFVVGLIAALCGGCASPQPKLAAVNTSDLAAQARDMAQNYLRTNSKTSGWVSSLLGFFGVGGGQEEKQGYSLTVSTNETYAVDTGTNTSGRIALENLAVISDTRTVVTTFPYRPAASTPVSGPVPPVSIVLPPQGGPVVNPQLPPPVVNPPVTNVAPTGGVSDVFAPITNPGLPPLNIEDLLKSKGSR